MSSLLRNRPDMNQDYRPLHQDEAPSADFKSLGVIEGSGSVRKHRRAVYVGVATLLMSLAVNVMLVIVNGRLQRSCDDRGKTKYSESRAMTSHIYDLISPGGITFDTDVPFRTHTEYWSPNISDAVANAAWDAIDTNPMAVSLHDDYAKQVGLGPSTRFPWDTERSIYYVKGIHDLHCLVCYLFQHSTLR